MKYLKSIILFLFNLLKSIVFSIYNIVKRFFKFVNRKKRYAIPFYSIVFYIFFVVLLVITSGDPTYNKVLENKRINDVTHINPIQVNKIVKPRSIEEIIYVINTTTGPVSIGGGKYSMGGQTGYENSLHIDTRAFNKIIALDTVTKQVTVQSGILWKDLQKFIDPYDLSIKIMQTYANFSVGGSISVNCHGRYIGHGAIISSVLELKIITANGEVITASRTENQDIFNAAIGGYGGIGVIAEATLQLVDNVKVERQSELVKVEAYNDYFNRNIKGNDDVIFQNGDLYPPNFDIIHNVAWKVTDKELTDFNRLTPQDESYWLEQKLVEVVSWGHFGKSVRRNIIDPIVFRSEKVTWRNKEASYDVKELEPESRYKQTYVLQEYFIPFNNITTFIPKMKAIFDKYDVNVINVSLRHALPENESFLSWADEEVFAFVIYYKQGTNPESKEIVKQWTLEMTEAILSENGKWYLPYQPHASFEQFEKAYPKSNKYFDLKNTVDPDNRFTNKLLDKYNPSIKNTVYKERDLISGYYRSEEQSILTVPEWYLVFNPKEYADFLEDGNNPSEFPFYAAIDEYWKLYDRSMKLVSEAYPHNEEYTTMLKVIGTSVTMEYAGKMIYENTIGKVFGWLADDEPSDKEKKIIQAHRAYSDFIYDTAWYEFEFLPWIKQVWTVSDTSGGNWLRKWERTLFFTIEFSFKAGYAQLIEWAAKASYEEPVTDIFLMISSEEPISSKRIKVFKEHDDKKVVAIPRWGAFTEVLLDISESNIDIIEIAGNDEIVISVLADNHNNIDFEGIELLYESQVVTNRAVKRLVYLVPVNKMLRFITYVKYMRSDVEHIFDY